MADKGAKISIKILGTGCARCNKLTDFTADVVKVNGFDAEIQKIGDIELILKYRVMSTPALVINEKVVSFGRVPSKEEIRTFIEKAGLE
jgi:small redox-active disulfide protein 2